MTPKWFLFSYFLIQTLSSSMAQVITVRNIATNQPIGDVLIFTQNKTKSQQTDFLGNADVSLFSLSDTLFFRHTAYHFYSTTLNQIINNNSIVELKVANLRFDEVVISANKWEQDSREIPNKIVSISPKDINFNNPQTSADMLESSGQVFVQKSQLGGGSPMLRGFAANRVLIIVDGVRMNNAIFRNGNLQNVIAVDPNTLQGAEVLFGPGSVMYGSDALGGVMDFHTKELNFSSVRNTEGTVMLRTSSANFEKTGHADFAISGGKLASFSSITYSNFDDLKSGKQRTAKFPEFGKRLSYINTINGVDQIIVNENVNKQIHSEYRQLNLMQKFKFRLNDKLDISYSIQHASTSDIPRYDRLTEREDDGSLRFAVWEYGPQKWTSHLLQSTLFKESTFFNQAKISLNFQEVEESRVDRKIDDALLRERIEEVKVYSLNLDFDKVFNDNTQLYYGLDASRNDISSSGIRRNIVDGTISSTTPRYPDGGSHYNSLAGYFSLINNISNDFTLSLGARYSAVWLEALLLENNELNFPYDQFELNNRALNGSIGLTFSPNNTTQVNFLASSGFRSPNIDDVGKVFEGVNNNIVVPNKDLRPEYSYNLELGFKKIIAHKVQFEASGFISFLDDAHVRRDFQFNGLDSLLFDGQKLKVQALINTGSALIYGLSVSAKAELSHTITLHSTLTTMNGKDQDDLPLRHVTPTFGETKIVYSKRKYRAELFTRYNGAIPFENLAPSEQDKAYLYTADGALSWGTLNIRSSYSLKENIQINAALENIFDKHYRPYSSGISAAGRNFILSIKMDI